MTFEEIAGFTCDEDGKTVTCQYLLDAEESVDRMDGFSGATEFNAFKKEVRQAKGIEKLELLREKKEEFKAEKRIRTIPDNVWKWKCGGKTVVEKDEVTKYLRKPEENACNLIARTFGKTGKWDGSSTSFPFGVSEKICLDEFPPAKKTRAKKEPTCTLKDARNKITDNLTTKLSKKRAKKTRQPIELAIDVVQGKDKSCEVIKCDA